MTNQENNPANTQEEANEQLKDSQAQENGSNNNPVVEPDKEKIDRAVAFINDTIGNTFYNTSVIIGSYILENFFDNNIELAKSKNPHKSASYNKLQNHPDLKIHLNQLNLMVRVAAQEKYLQANTIKVVDKDEKLTKKQKRMLLPEEKDALTFSHCVELLRLDDDETKIEFAKKAVKENLSVRNLRELINDHLQKTKKTIDKPEKQYLKLDSSLMFLSESYSGIIEKPSVDDLKKLSTPQLESMKTSIQNFLKIKQDDITNKCNELVAKIDTVISEKPKPGRPSNP